MQVDNDSATGKGMTKMAGDNKRGLGGKIDKKTKQRIQSLGGQNSPQNFKYNRELASKAGRIGGQN